jgi:hypothetical protein
LSTLIIFIYREKKNSWAYLFMASYALKSNFIFSNMYLLYSGDLLLVCTAGKPEDTYWYMQGFIKKGNTAPSLCWSRGGGVTFAIGKI